jgi:hypothetical protein
LKPLLSAFGKTFATLYIQPTPISNQSLDIKTKYPQYIPGSTILSLKGDEAEEIIRNRTCALGKCVINDKMKATGLLLPNVCSGIKGKEGDKPKVVSFVEADCDSYQRFELEAFADQVNLKKDSSETDKELCRRVKRALLERYSTGF